MFPYNYNPKPARVWSRVENACAFNVTNVSENDLIYIPLTNQTVSPVQATQINQMIQKGNVLQYKKNSSSLTKKQKYSKIARGQWTGNKSYATQGYQYTNPNITGLLRVNYTVYPNPNFIVGAPNNPSGPFQPNVLNPNNCSNESIIDGGSLVCNKYADPCTGEIIQTINNPLCYPTTCSDVPGQIQGLCWNPAIPTWFPRNNLTMNNSNDGWPNGYKDFVSAVYPATPTLNGTLNNNNTVFLNWYVQTTPCLPIVSWNVYENGNLILNIPYLTYTTINNLLTNTTYTFYVVGIVNNTTQTQPSNNVTINVPLIVPVIVPPVITSILNDNNSINGNSITLNWSSPANSNITNWVLYSGNTSTSMGSSLTTTINNLSASSTYSYYVVGYNNNVQISSSNTTIVTISSPTAPTITGTLSNSSNSYVLTLSWISPTNSNVTNWYLNNGTTNTSMGSLTTTTINPSTGQTYSYYVVGYNGIIQTLPSNSYTVNVPTAPTITGTLSYSGSSYSVTLSWTAPTNITVSNWFLNNGTSMGSLTTTTISNLTQGQTYNYFVYGTDTTNNILTLLSSTYSVYVPIPAPPSSISGNWNQNGNNGIVNNYIVLNWSPPPSYNVTSWFLYTGYTSYTSSNMNTSTSTQINYLNQGQTYNYYVVGYINNTSQITQSNTISVAIPSASGF